MKTWLAAAMIGFAARASAQTEIAKERVIVGPDGRAIALFLRESGTRSSPHSGEPPAKLYVVTVGDTQEQDERAWERGQNYLGRFAPFAFDAAQYFHRADGSWFMWNWHPQGSSDQENDWFKAYLDRKDVMDFMDDPYAAGDFGRPCPDWEKDRGRTCDFILKRKPLRPADLPFPLDKIGPQSREAILGVFRYNADGTMKILLRWEDEEDGPAQRVFERLADEIEAAVKDGGAGQPGS